MLFMILQASTILVMLCVIGWVFPVSLTSSQLGLLAVLVVLLLWQAFQSYSAREQERAREEAQRVDKMVTQMHARETKPARDRNPTVYWDYTSLPSEDVDKTLDVLKKALKKQDIEGYEVRAYVDASSRMSPEVEACLNNACTLVKVIGKNEYDTIDRELNGDMNMASLVQGDVFVVLAAFEQHEEYAFVLDGFRAVGKTSLLVCAGEGEGKERGVRGVDTLTLSGLV